MSSFAAFVVTMRIGVSFILSSARSARMKSMPFISGMFQSVMTRSTSAADTCSSPSRPLRASTTSW
jgi:hypothetical protein